MVPAGPTLLAVSFNEVAVVVTAAGVDLTALVAAPSATNGVRITSTTKELTGAGPHEAKNPHISAVAMMVSWVEGFFIRQGTHAPTRPQYSKEKIDRKKSDSPSSRAQAPGRGHLL